MVPNVLRDAQNQFDRLDRIAAGFEELGLARLRCTDDDRAHHGGMIMGGGAGPFEGELIAFGQRPAAGLVAAQKRIAPEPMTNSFG